MESNLEYHIYYNAFSKGIKDYHVSYLNCLGYKKCSQSAIDSMEIENCDMNIDRLDVDICERINKGIEGYSKESVMEITSLRSSLDSIDYYKNLKNQYIKKSKLQSPQDFYKGSFYFNAKVNGIKIIKNVTVIFDKDFKIVKIK
jgi:hypothetical protein